MKSEFVMAINQICSERNLPQEVIFEAIEAALVSAYKRNFGGGQNVKATIDLKTGTPHVFVERVVVEKVGDERFEISLEEAQKIDPQAELGSLVKIEVTPKSFGRIAAQTAKQVILQRIREAERDALFSSYADREGELINGMVASITSQAVTLNLGRTEAIMPRSQLVPGERYRIGQRVRAYVMEVRRTGRGPQIIVSRTHRNMLRRLLELEVPEIFNGIVEIKGIAREAGSRSKVAVAALQEGVDPVGSCVGIRGMRIQSIVNELGGEKIDIVEWSPDTRTFIANALSPAKVSYVVLGDPATDGKTATVVVPDDQLSLAIGKEGQNARLAAKLTGWRIDIKSLSEAAAENLEPQKEVRTIASEERDILAMAEAILLGKVPVKAEPVAGQEQEAAPEPTADAAMPEKVEEGVTEAETIEERQPPAAEAELEAEPPIEPPPPEVVEAATETEATPPLQPAEAEKESQPAATEQVVSIPTPAHYEYVEDEELERIRSTKKKKVRRRKPRELVFDEETGVLIPRRKHKRGDDLLEWEDLEI